MNAKIVATLASTILLSSSGMAANCAKNPSHSSCQNTTTVIDSSGLPTVVNGDAAKTVIGKAFQIGWSLDSTNKYAYADVRLSIQVLSGEKIGYGLRFYRDGVSVGAGGYNSPTAYWKTAGCNGAPDAVSDVNLSDIPSLQPFFNPEYVPIQHPTSSGVQVSLLRIGAFLGGGISAPFWTISNGSGCQYVSSGSANRSSWSVVEGYPLTSSYVAPIEFIPSDQ